MPTFNNGSGYYETSAWNRSGAALLKFDQGFKLVWGTKLHAFPSGAYYYFQPQQHNSGLVIDEADQVFVYTALDPMPNPTFTVQLSGAYWQGINSASATGGYDESKTDNFIYAFNRRDQLQWATFFGSTGSSGSFDVGQGIVNLGDYIYVTGITNCNNSPYNHCLTNIIPGSYCDQTYNAGMDNYISRFNKKLMTVGIDDKNTPALALSVYPNPGKGLYTISFSNPGTLLSGKALQLQVTDMSGRRVAGTKYIPHPGYNAFNIDLGALASGMYQLTLSEGGQQQCIKLIKE